LLVITWLASRSAFFLFSLYAIKFDNTFHDFRWKLPKALFRIRIVHKPSTQLGFDQHPWLTSRNLIFVLRPVLWPWSPPVRKGMPAAATSLASVVKVWMGLLMWKGAMREATSELT
jgi:hypothetical protein